MAIEDDGSERPLTVDELLEDIQNSVDVEYYDDATVMLYYRNQSVDITDK